MNLRITGYDREVDRGDDEGMHVTYDMDSDRPIVSLMFWMDNGATPIEMLYPVKPGTDGRYIRCSNMTSRMGMTPDSMESVMNSQPMPKAACASRWALSSAATNSPSR